MTALALPQAADQILDLFHRFREEVGDAIAAASLTLATTNWLRGGAASPEANGPFTVRQAAEKLGVSEWTVRDLVKTGKLTCDRIGTGRGTIRFSAADLASYRESARPSAAIPSRRRRLLGVE
ncbi:MAG: helix-turn-helix domain-containing protein [Planctomycetes bacterium]|nr:helix-turn-helix domain-containing protein [Planctomycetota bacterium]